VDIVNFDEHDSGDDETVEYVSKEAEEAEKEGHEMGRPNSLLNRMISHGNKKTEEQIARDLAAKNQAGATGNTVTHNTVTQR
jgi:DNA invertase Pin-like site-specific DNA recombinase